MVGVTTLEIIKMKQYNFRDVIQHKLWYNGREPSRASHGFHKGEFFVYKINNIIYNTGYGYHITFNKPNNSYGVSFIEGNSFLNLRYSVWRGVISKYGYLL